MKPKRIILLRHGQSEGNVDKSVYETTPDWQVDLTKVGEQQSFNVGKKLYNIIEDKSVMFYVSPYIRTKKTFANIQKSFFNNKIAYREEPKLREHEWGHYRGEQESYEEELRRINYGEFFYRYPDGESCADAYDRVDSFINAMYRHFEDPKYPENVVIVTHGILIRLFFMRWFHWTVEEYENARHPHNCETFELELVDDKYKFKDVPMLQ